MSLYSPIACTPGANAVATRSSVAVAPLGTAAERVTGPVQSQGGPGGSDEIVAARPFSVPVSLRFEPLAVTAHPPCEPSPGAETAVSS